MIIDIVLVYADGNGDLEKVLTKVTSELVLRGHQPRIFQSYRPANTEWEASLPEVYYYGERSGLEYENPDSLIEGYTGSLRSHGKPDIVLATRAPITNYVCRAAMAQVPGPIPKIFSWLQGPPEEYGNVEALRFSDAHLAITDQLEEDLQRFVQQENSVYPIGNPAILEEHKRVIRPSQAHFIFVGELLQHQKRFDLLFHALDKVKDNAVLTVIGTGEDEAQLKKIAADMGLQEHIRWISENENAWQHIQEATALLLPSDYEESDAVLIEALSRGIAPITTIDNGIITKDNGWLLEPGDEEGLALILQDIVSGQQELPSAEVCQQSVTAFHYKTVVKRLEEALVQEIVTSDYQLTIHEEQFLHKPVLGSILDTAINGIEYLGTTQEELDLDYVSAFFTQRFMTERMFQRTEPIAAQVAYPKVESVDYRYQHAIVTFLLINTYTVDQSIEKVYCRLELFNKNGIWKIGKWSKEAPFRERDQVKITKDERKKMVLVARNSSGSNTYALFKVIPAEIQEAFDVELLQQQPTQEFQEKVTAADVLIITEANITHNKRLYHPNQLIIDLWHGFPLKAMGFADKNEQNKNMLADRWGSINYLCSYSENFSRLLTRCFKLDPQTIEITGAPRNDFLLRPSAKQDFLREEFEIDPEQKQVIFFMPTYRQVAHNDRSDTNLNRNNIFGLEQFDADEMHQFLQQNNLELVVKLHPAEEKLFLNHFDMQQHIHLLTDEMLTRYNMDLYEVLPAADMLITDYSSIYFDYLLMDRPIIFLPVDLASYQSNRGFILDSYSNWTPGPKVTTQLDLQNTIERFMTKPEWFASERKQIKNQVHAYQDDDSAERVWKFIMEKITYHS